MKKKKKCRKCKNQYTPKLINGLPTSAYCNKCLVIVNREKREKKREEKKLREIKKKERKINSKKYQKKTWSKLVKELDRVFSLFIRQRDGQCYTPTPKCNNVLQNGHLISRRHMSTRWDEINCNGQCGSHNNLHNYQPEIYTSEFIRKNGQQVYLDLEKRSRQIKQWSIPELEEKIQYYKNKLK